MRFRNSQDPADPELIVAAASDRLAGLDRGASWIGVRPAGSGDPYQRLPTAVGAAALRARWPSDRYPPGAYEFAARAIDRAGNASRSGLRRDGSAMVLTNPLKAATSLEAGLGGRALSWRRCRRQRGRRRCARRRAVALARRPGRLTISFGRRMRLSGRLLSGAERPVAGAPVRVLERLAGRARRLGAVTDAAGRFSVVLPPGPSRQVWAAFGGDRGLAASRSRATELDVRSGIAFRASAASAAVGGRPIVFSGRLRAAPTDPLPRERPIELQFRVGRMPWQEFRTVQTDGRGRFRYAYRFSDDDSRGALFQFRATTAAQGDWPYEPGSSRPVAVRGR